MANETALLVIDVQVAIMDGPDPSCPPAYRRDEVLGNIDRLLGKARATKTPIIYVQHDEPTFDALKPGAPGWQIHPAVAPVNGELVVRKQAADAFYGTPLRAELDARGITRLVVAGAETQYCIDTTIRRALSLDYDVTLAADAHTTGGDTDALTAAQIVAHHNATLGILPHPKHAVTVKPTSDITF